MPRALALATLALLAWSVVGCHDLFTWFLEVLPVLLGLPLLVYLAPSYRLTNLLYALLALHASILILGGHYTYALMPLFEYLKSAFHLDRNYYDRLGHFAQGFVPAILVREYLLRWTPLPRGRLVAFLSFCCCMALTAMYELFEFAATRLTGSAAEAFLGTQGDVWDTQWDMTFCLFGALAALLLLAPLHDRALARLANPSRSIQSNAVQSKHE